VEAHTLQAKGDYAGQPITGLINAAPDFEGNSEVLNGFSELILDLYGEEAGDNPTTSSSCPGRVDQVPYNTIPYSFGREDGVPDRRGAPNTIGTTNTHQ
jgi:hypothetical protein